MNYTDQILENRWFNFFKQLMFNLGVLICVVLCGLLVLIYGFKFGVYEVLSNSQAPIFVKGDLIVTKPESEYKVGDILKFTTTMHVTHRLIAIGKDGTYYCHGDNVQSVNPDNGSKIVSWQEDSEYLQGLIDSDVALTINNARDYQAISKNQVQGKVVFQLDGVGAFFGFVKEHIVLCILLIVGIKYSCSVIEQELSYKKARRLM